MSEPDITKRQFFPQDLVVKKGDTKKVKDVLGIVGLIHINFGDTKELCMEARSFHDHMEPCYLHYKCELGGTMHGKYDILAEPTIQKATQMEIEAWKENEKKKFQARKKRQDNKSKVR